MSSAPNKLPDVGLFHAGIRSLHEFENTEIHPLVEGLLSPTDREKCFIAAYYRLVANVRSIIALNDPSHFQAIGMLTRCMFELTIDVLLIDKIADSISKIYAFSHLERLRAALKVVALSDAGKTQDDVQIHKAYITSQEAGIYAECKKLWRRSRARRGKLRA